MKRHAQALCDLAAAHGFEFLGVNCKGARRYEHPSGAVVMVTTGLSEQAARRLEVQVRKAAGVPEAVNKRVPAAVRARQAQGREALQQQRARLDRERAALLAQRDRLLAGHGASLSSSEVVAIERRIELADRERAVLLRQMTELPASAEHRGTAAGARHRSGVSS